MSGNPLLRHITNREFALAAEYEALRDAPERRDAIRQELYKLRWRLNEDSARKFHSSGKGRRDTALCEGLPVVTGSRRRRFLTATMLPGNILPKKLAHTMPTLQAIMRNGSDRSRSITELAAELFCSQAAAKFKYFADRNKLMSAYGV